MSQKSYSLSSLQTRLEIVVLNHAEHNKFSIELHYALGPFHPKIINLQKELDNMVDEMNAIRKNIRKLEKEKSETD